MSPAERMLGKEIDSRDRFRGDRDFALLEDRLGRGAAIRSERRRQTASGSEVGTVSQSLVSRRIGESWPQGIRPHEERGLLERTIDRIFGHRGDEATPDVSIVSSDRP
jgi:hypothetical protein